jgi:hypothetical protein
MRQLRTHRQESGGPPLIITPEVALRIYARAHDHYDDACRKIADERGALRRKMRAEGIDLKAFDERRRSRAR